jgi:1-acyl-sn-glycerol-3-phosphate acyltransferase
MPPMNTFKPPSKQELQLAFLPLQAWRAACRPVFFGLENVPAARPLLFVGNHQLFGALDAPLLFYELYLKKDIFLRSLGDHLHFKIPLWRQALHRFGVVDGNPESCRALLAAGECVLVFPGGGREVAKRKGEKYQLLWKERLGFVRMALEVGCTIVPFAAVGVEDWFEIVLDGDEIMRSRVGWVLHKLGVPPYAVVPIAKGSRGLLPRPAQQLFYIAEPFETRAHQGQQGDEVLCRSIRDEVKRRVEEGIKVLQGSAAPRGA